MWMFIGIRRWPGDHIGLIKFVRMHSSVIKILIRFQTFSVVGWSKSVSKNRRRQKHVSHVWNVLVILWNVHSAEFPRCFFRFALENVHFRFTGIQSVMCLSVKSPGSSLRWTSWQLLLIFYPVCVVVITYTATLLKNGYENLSVSQHSLNKPNKHESISSFFHLCAFW